MSNFFFHIIVYYKLNLIIIGDKADDKTIDKIIHHVDLWNRPDIAEKEIFNLDNNKVLQKLQVCFN